LTPGQIISFLTTLDKYDKIKCLKVIFKNIDTGRRELFNEAEWAFSLILKCILKTFVTKEDKDMVKQILISSCSEGRYRTEIITLCINHIMS